MGFFGKLFGGFSKFFGSGASSAASDHLDQGMAALTAGQYGQAIAHCTEAIQLRPNCN